MSQTHLYLQEREVSDGAPALEEIQEPADILRFMELLMKDMQAHTEAEGINPTSTTETTFSKGA